MAFLVEDGSGVYAANSYVTTAEVSTFLTDRARNTAWDAATSANQQAAAIEATDYIEQRFADKFKGLKYFRAIKAASGALTFTAQPSAADIVTIGSTVYTFQSTLSSAYDVLIGDDIEDTTANLVYAINANTSYSGTKFHASTVAHPDVEAAQWYEWTIRVTASADGADGNSIVSTTDVTGASWTGATLSGGNDRGFDQPLSFPRAQLYTPDGTLVLGIPQNLKNAVCEYASRALSATLLSDPTVDAVGGTVKKKKEKVGPLETETEYFGGLQQILGSYPAADRWLTEYLFPANRLFRG